MKVLVTGGAGFIGSHIAQRMAQDGHQVVILDNLATGRLVNLESFAEQVDFTEGDVRDAALVKELCQGCDLVFHQAAVVSVPYSVEHPQESHDVNIQGTLNTLLAARDAGVKRLVFASSAAIYGEDPVLPKQEQMRPTPISPYAVEKITGEHYLSAFHQLYGLQTVALRYFNVFGPRQDPSSPYSGVISIFVDRLLRQQDPAIFGDGEQYRDFVFVQDVVQANLLAATHDAAPGKVFNVGRGERTSLNQLVEILSRITGYQASPTHGEPRAGDIRESLADITRIHETLGYAPAVAVDKGLAALVEYARR
jgi:UDP-glucose 4-epimerase